MLVRELINVLKNFPKKHIFTLLIGLVLIISISLLGSIKFTEDNQYSELTKSLSLSSLTDDNQIEESDIEETIEETVTAEDKIIKEEEGTR